MSDFEEKINRAVKLLQENEPKSFGYALAFSGGKDSIVIKQLVFQTRGE